MGRSNYVAALLLLLATSTVIMAGRDSLSDETSLNKPFTASYSRLDHAACVSLFYRDGRIGCGTEDRSVQIGVLQYFDGDLPAVEEPYVAVMEEFMLNEASIKTLAYGKEGNGYLKGVLVLNSTNYDGNDDASYRSPDAVYPQGYGTPSEGMNYGYYKYPWNANGENLLMYDFYGLPMAFVKNSEVADSLRETANDGSKNSDIVAEFNYYMGPKDVTSPECLAWIDKASGDWAPKCLPLGGNSVWATAGPSPTYGSNSDQGKPVIMVAAGIDGTGLFQDLVPAANTAASNILTLLMAAKLIGESVSDKVLAGLNNQIVFGFFQGESHGFLGSRNFFRDVAYPGFSCNSELVRANPSSGEDSPMACLNPVYPNLDFMGLGQINGMIAVDQIGVATTNNLLYVHADQNNDDYGNFLANVLMNTGTNSMTVVASSAEGSNDYGYPYPPSPLTSLLALSEGAAGGAVVTGFDYAYANRAPYHSHRDSQDYVSMNLKSIAAAATIVARSAIAAAYDDGNYDHETAAAYAMDLIPNGASYEDEDLVAMAECFYYDGQCDLISGHASTQASNIKATTGISVGRGESLGIPANYYVSVYHGNYGQPFAYVNNNQYGAYDGNDFGSHGTDGVGLQPRALINALIGFLNDFLGRSSANFEEVTCRRMIDCKDVEFCDTYSEKATCTGSGVCVCERARYHVALDEALKPAVNKPTGYFEFDENEAGISPVYTEPNWSQFVGVRVYRDAGPIPGFVTLAIGAVVMALSICSAFVLRVGLKKEKLY